MCRRPLLQPWDTSEAALNMNVVQTCIACQHECVYLQEYGQILLEAT